MSLRNRVSRGRWAILAAAGACWGCRTPTQITVEITTDVPCDDPKTKANTTLSVGTLSETLEEKPPVVVTSECKRLDAGTWRIGSIVLVPSGDKGAEVGIRVVTGINKDPSLCKDQPADCIIARRSLRFVPHTELYLPVGLDADCTNVPCGTTTTCVSGKCVSATIDDSSRCTTPTACDESALPHPSGGDAGVDGGGDAGVDAGGDVGGDGGDGGTDGATAGVWQPIASATKGRLAHVAAFVDGAMIVWGGQLAGISGYTSSGERYDPKANTWTGISSPPIGGRHSFVVAQVNATTMLVWGGLGMYTDGAIYDAKADTWKKMDPTGTFPFGPRQDVAWTFATERRELIIWGGEDGSGNLDDGARYSIDTDTWTKLAAVPTGVARRFGATAVWNGKTVVIYGGGCPGGYCNDALEYDPAGDSWKVLPDPPIAHRRDVYGLRTGPTANLATFFGGGLFTASEAYADGVSWDGTKWIVVPAIPAPVLPSPARRYPTVWWDGRRINVWGGVSDGVARADGAAFDPTTSTWTTLPPAALSPREKATVVWTGTSAILFGGDGDPDPALDRELPEGAMFTP